MRLERIMELKACNRQDALEFAISCGWYGAEKLDAMKKGTWDGKGK